MNNQNALLLSFSAYLMVQHRLDVTAAAEKFANHVGLQATGGVELPADLLAALDKPGNPADYLSTKDLRYLRWLLITQSQTIKALRDQLKPKPEETLCSRI